MDGQSGGKVRQGQIETEMFLFFFFFLNLNLTYKKIVYWIDGEKMSVIYSWFK